MSATVIHEHVLDGCSPEPLAHYLKALAVLRLVSEQRDPAVRGAWRGRAFVLHTHLTRDEVLAFFLTGYSPTPIVAPWNGGSGFAPNDNQEAIAAIADGAAGRLHDYRETVVAARSLFARFAGDKKVEKENKDTLFLACRNGLPDRALGWLDAACVLTDERPIYPPLLGTGGNDGRLDFTNNFMQRLLAVMEPVHGAATAGARGLLEGALFGTPARGLEKAAVGQFLPGSAGGANGTAGFDAAALVNPWDFVLMLEGALHFAAAAVKRLGPAGGGQPSVPFTVRSSGVGYASASTSDEESGATRGEMWLPTWQRPATAQELQQLFSEGRAQVGGRAARHGVDFARAAASLGVDRGIDAFHRYGFQVRNGLSYLATPLERVPVRANPKVRLLDEIDGWIEHLRGRANAKLAPASIGRAMRGLDSAILALCRDGGARTLQETLIALGACEEQLVTSLRWAKESNLRPLAGLSPQWLTDGDDGSAEWRLAASLASLYHRAIGSFREYLEPVVSRVGKDGRGWAKWKEPAENPLLAVWTRTDLASNLGRVLDRWLLTADTADAPGGGVTGRIPASLADVQSLLAGELDEERIAALVWGLAALEWPSVRNFSFRGRLTPSEPAFALLKLCAAGQEVRGVAVPLNRTIFRRAVAGQLPEASRLAARRLRASGLPAAVDVLTASVAWTRRCAAAVVFPLSSASVEQLASTVLRAKGTAAASEG